MYIKVTRDSKWIFPPEDWVQVNIDSSSKGNQGETWLCRCLRMGPGCFGFSHIIGLCSSGIFE